jgi:hypothetical protein
MKFIVAVVVAGSAMTLAKPNAVLAQVTPTLPPPFVGAPMNDNPRAGQFSLSFDTTGKLVRIGSAPVGADSRNYPVFDLTPATARPPQNRARVVSAPRQVGDVSPH